MLVLGRKAGESILIGSDIEIMVVRVGVNSVRLSVKAPPHVTVNRREVAEAIDRQKMIDQIQQRRVK